MPEIELTAKEKRTQPIAALLEDLAYAETEPAVSLAYVLADVRHYCDIHGIDYLGVVQEAESVYNENVRGDAE